MTLWDGQVLTAQRLTEAIDARIAAAGGSGGGGTTTSAVLPKSYRLTARPTGWYSWWDTDTSDAQTFGEIRTLQGRGAWFRLGFSYDRTDGSCAVAAAKIAQTATFAVPPNPVDYDGNPAAWADVTFNNGGLDVSLEAQLLAAVDSNAAPVTTLNLVGPPLNSGTWAGEANYGKLPGLVWSDWIHCPPQGNPTNFAAGSLLWTLVKFTGTVAIYRALGETFDALTSGARYHRSYVQSGDAVTDPTDFLSSTRSTKSAGLTIQYYSHKPAVQVFHTGDSTEQPVNNHVALSVLALSTAARPIEYCGTGTGGLSAAEFAEKLRPVIAGSYRSIVFLRMWSPNAGTNREISERGWAENMQIATDVLAAGGVPVLMTPYPNPGRITTAAQEAIRLDMVRRVRDAGASGARVLDLDALMSDNASPIANIIAPYSDDGTHPTTDGQILMASLATTPLLTDILEG